MAESEANKRIREAYEESGGSKKQVHDLINAGKAKGDKTKISIQQVRQWFLENKHTLKKGKKFNSYVAPEPQHELQIDMLEYKYKQPDRDIVNPKAPEGEPKAPKSTRPELRRMGEDRPPYAVLGIDPFTKKMAVEPMVLKEGQDWRRAIENIVDKLGKPKIIYSDHDSATMSKELQGYFERNGMKNIITKQHANVAERGIRYLKNRLDNILEKARYRDGEPESYWKRHYKPIVEHYNKTKQDTINMTPEQATNPQNEFDVKTNLEIKARHDRKWEPLEVGDIVRGFRKREKFEKERTGDYEEGQRRVVGIETSMGQKFYKLFGTDHKYLRADIALIKKKPGAQAPAQEEVSAGVNAARNIKLDDDARAVEAPKVKKEPKFPDWDAYKKLNKKDREKALARGKRETEKALE